MFTGCAGLEISFMWKRPYNYKEGFVINAGLFIAGLLLQLITGRVNLELLAYPVNIIVLVLFLAGLIIIHLASKKVYFFRMLSSLQFAFPSIASVVILIIFMGIFSQFQSDVKLSGMMGRLGLRQMLSAWYFVLIFLWLIVILGMVIIRKASRFNFKKDIPFMLNHLGLFIALLGGILGSADLQRLKLVASTGNIEWRAFDSRQNMVELPLAIQLNHFTIDEYPPKLILIKDEYRDLIMFEREPRRYVSDVTVYTQSGKIINGTIEVNKPLKIEGWKIYQSSYDKSKGKWSTVSILELVRDTWMPVVYVGIGMMIAGAVCMFVFIPKRKEEEV